MNIGKVAPQRERVAAKLKLEEGIISFEDKENIKRER